MFYDFTNNNQTNTWGSIRGYHFVGNGFVKNLYSQISEYIKAGSWTKYNWLLRKDMKSQRPMVSILKRDLGTRNFDNFLDGED
jgi:hypothetical protein